MSLGFLVNLMLLIVGTSVIKQFHLTCFFNDMQCIVMNELKKLIVIEQLRLCYMLLMDRIQQLERSSIKLST